MRLINTYSLHLEEFFGYGCPTYAILSHTWGEEETSYQEWLEWESGDAYQRGQTEMKSDFLKIKSACHTAQTYGHEYLWVDTNCIDKESSAELSEAINSMFSWYRDSLECLVYLEDYPTRPWGDSSPFDSLSKCRWFTRGWTLQELLAPKDMVFFNREWGLIGTKRSLSWEISAITGIDEDTLKEPGRVHAACAARKMSWASSRQTTRTEDLAYCLLGLFSMNMPLLYGEGSEAFWRLQEEIIRVSTDQSLFAWDWPSKVPPSHRQGNHCVTMLAPFPSVFANCSTVIKETPRKMVRQPRLKEFAMTNLGLNISLPLVVKSEDGKYYGALSCRHEHFQECSMCVPLLYHSTAGTFYRGPSQDILLIPHRYIPKEPTSISVPRFSESPNTAQMLELDYPRPLYGDTQVLLFPFNNILERWEICTPRQKMLTSKRVRGKKWGIGSIIWGTCLSFDDKDNGDQSTFNILWAKDSLWRHVSAEPIHSDLMGSVGDGVLERALRDAPLAGQTTAFFRDLMLEVGFEYSTINADGGRCISLFLNERSEIAA